VERGGLRRVALAFLLASLFVSCGDSGDQYAPIPDEPGARATVVAGIVRDADDHAVADAIVAIDPARDGVAESVHQLLADPTASAKTTSSRRVTTTNDAGRFAFSDVATGDYFLQVIADDHLGASRAITVPDPIAFADTIYVDVDLTPTGTLTGVATLENGVVHSGSVVYAEGTSYDAVTDVAGAYTILDVPVGSYAVRASHAGYLDDTENATITNAGEVVPLSAMLLRLNSNIPPVATIASASPLLAAFPVDFIASGMDADGSVVLYEWDWEDDGVFDYANSTSADASHAYAAGSYRAKLRVTDDDGAIGLAVIEFTIVDAPANRAYMSTTGSDANDGSIGSPVATLTKAYQLAQLNGKDEILIGEGSYLQVPIFRHRHPRRATSQLERGHGAFAVQYRRRARDRQHHHDRHVDSPPRAQHGAGGERHELDRTLLARVELESAFRGVSVPGRERTLRPDGVGGLAGSERFLGNFRWPGKL